MTVFPSWPRPWSGGVIFRAEVKVDERQLGVGILKCDWPKPPLTLAGRLGASDKLQLPGAGGHDGARLHLAATGRR